MSTIDQIYSIKYVAEQLGVTDNTIRNWEKELDGLIIIKRDQDDKRYYTYQNIEQFHLLQRLKRDGLKFDAIRSVFQSMIEKGVYPNPQEVSSLIVYPKEQENERQIIQPMGPEILTALTVLKEYMSSFETQFNLMNQKVDMIHEHVQSFEQRIKSIELLPQHSQKLLDDQKTMREEVGAAKEEIQKTIEKLGNEFTLKLKNALETTEKAISDQESSVIEKAVSVAVEEVKKQMPRKKFLGLF